MSVAARAFASAVRVASRPRVTPTVRRVTPPLRTHIRAMAAPGDEQAAALEAHLKGMANSGEPTLFDKIVAKEIPADVSTRITFAWRSATSHPRPRRISS